jgi:hypothetical protein
MGKIIKFPSEEDRLEGMEFVEIIHSDTYLAMAQNISDFITGLPLSHSEKAELLNLLFEQTEQAEIDSFLQGFLMGMVFSEDQQ